jgi:hypothetical protein
MNIVELFFFLLFCYLSFETSLFVFAYLGWIGAVVIFPIVFVSCFQSLKLLALFLKRRHDDRKKKISG